MDEKFIEELYNVYIDMLFILLLVLVWDWVNGVLKILFFELVD